MRILKKLKKYGIMAAAVTLVTVMLSGSPLMAFAEQYTAAAETKKDKEDDSSDNKNDDTGKSGSTDKKESTGKDGSTDNNGSVVNSDSTDKTDDTDKENKTETGKEDNVKSGAKGAVNAEPNTESTETSETGKESEAETGTDVIPPETGGIVLPPETAAESVTESESESETESSSEEETKKSSKKKSKKKKSKKKKSKKKKSSGKKSSKKKSSEKNSKKSSSSNRHLTGVAPWKGHQVDLPDLIVKEQLRFKTVDNATYKAAADKITVLEEMKDDSREVGYIDAGGQVTVLAEEDGWDYIECGMLRGFVKDDSLENISKLTDIRNDILQRALSGTYDIVETGRISSLQNEKFRNPETLTVSTDENKAFTYKKITAEETVIRKKYALVDTAAGLKSDEEKAQEESSGDGQTGNDTAATETKKTGETDASESTDPSGNSDETNISVKQAESVDIKEEKSDDSRTIGTIKDGGLLYIIADADQDWVYVESGDVRGFIESSYLDTGKEVNKKVKKSGEDEFSAAKEKVDPEENKAFFYSLQTTVDKTSEQEFRETIIKAAAQCVGNPYVWGGTSLTNGADCSGFVQTIYRNYGISLPRVADDQSEVGTKITVDSAEAGDLIFFADSSGYVYHVAISTGDGGTIEARSERYGIVRMEHRAGASWATDVISSLFDD